MTDFLLNAATTGDSMLEATTGVDGIDVADINGESQFSFRVEILPVDGVTSGRLFDDSAGTIYLSIINTSGGLGMRAWDGSAHDLNADAFIPMDDWIQVRGDFDGTANPMTATFYTRDAGTALDDDTGWTQLGSVIEEVGVFGGQSTVIGAPFSIGSRSGMPKLSLRRAFLGYGAANTPWIDIDMSDLSDAEVDASEFVDNAGVTWEIMDGQWYAQPGRNGAGPNRIDTIDSASRLSVPTSSDLTPVSGDIIEIDFTFEKYQSMGGNEPLVGRALCWYVNFIDSATVAWPQIFFSDGTYRGFNFLNATTGWEFVDGQRYRLRFQPVINGVGDWDVLGSKSDDNGETWDGPYTVNSGAPTTASINNGNQPLVFPFGAVQPDWIGIHGVSMVSGSDTVYDIKTGNLSARDLEREAFSDFASGRRVNIEGDEWAYVRPKTSIAGKTPELLLEAGDGNKMYPPLWADRSGNGHHAQLGSAAGADTNDPVPLRYEGSKYLWLPGSAGNYAQAEPVNLLDADTAHLVQSLGSWTGWGGLSDASFSPSGSPNGFGVGTCTMVQDAASGGVSRVVMTADRVDVDANTEYSVTAKVRNLTGAAKTMQLDGWLYAGATPTQYLNHPNQVVVSPNEWVTLDLTFTTGATIDSLDLWVAIEDATLTDDEFEWAEVCVREGSDATFVPSQRIVKALEMEIDYEPDPDLGWFANQVLFEGQNPSTNSGYRVYLTVSGNHRPTFWDTAGDPRAPSPDDPLMLNDFSRRVHKMTFDPDEDAGRWRGYIDGEQRWTVDGEGSVSGKTELSEFRIGSSNTSTAPLAGKVYRVTVRDGIDGPVVLEYRPGDAISQVDGGGLTWTVERAASGYRSRFVDRDKWALSTDDYFVVADADGLDFALDDDFTIVVALSVPDAAASYGIVAKSATSYTAATDGWVLNNSSGDDYLQFRTKGTAAADIASTPATVVAHQLHVLAGRRDTTADEIQAFLDGVAGAAVTDNATGTLANSEPLHIGRSNTAYMEGAIVSVALFREALTDDEIAEISDYLSGAAQSRLLLVGVS